MLRFALMGCGRIAKRHSELLGYKQIEGATLACVCDLDIEKARTIGEKFGVPYYTDAHQMMAEQKPDVVTILTESGRHAEHVIALAPYGKHLIVEKPMALTVADADKMIAACKAANIRLFVVKQNRFNVPVTKLREALEAGRFGKLVMGTVRVRWSRDQSYYAQDSWRGTWRFDGGVLTNQASHHVDLLEWMMGPVRSVFAKTSTALVDIEAEDTAVVVLEFMNGALGIIEATTAVRPKDLEGSISLLGERGAVEIGGFAVNKLKVWNFLDAGPGDADVIETHSVNPPNVYGFGHQAYYEHVVDAISNDRQYVIDGEAGRRSLQLINAIYESVETGKPVEVGSSDHVTRLGRG